MATAVAARRRPAADVPVVRPRGRGRSIATFLAVLLVVVLAWEGVKLLGGVPWRAPGALPGSPVLWNPPFRWPFANDLNLPHVWTIAWALGEPFQRGARESLAQYLLGAALYTWREALIGFLLGAA